MAQSEASEARAAGLRYVSCADDGWIRRVRRGRGFVYFGPAGRIRNRHTLERIRALAIPPAWTDVEICPDDRGHLQATGRDARGRKQYRYHARWRAMRDESKYARLAEFGAALPRLRSRIDRDLAREGLVRERVVATVVRLLERTLIRVGNDEYARSNRSYGLTTLRPAHVRVSGEEIRFRFRGKGGKEHEIDVRDRRAAAIVKRCRELPGHVLFGYLGEEGEPRTVGSADVNDYLREATGEEFTAKDFRTWAGTVLAAMALRDSPVPSSQAEQRRVINEAIAEVAAALGNTPAIARKSYVHPAVVEAYANGTLASAWRARRVRGLSVHESAVLALLRRRRRRETTKAA